MKRTLTFLPYFFSITLLSFVSSPGFTADKAEAGRFPAAEMPPMVRGEYNLSQQDLQTQLGTAKRKLMDLEAQKVKAFAVSNNLSSVEQSGIKNFHEYDTLLSARYVDEKGEYQPGLQLAQKDIDNINRLYTNYLRSNPLEGTVSAGQARKTLEWGIERLNELTKLHSNPDDKNNSQLQIIAKQMKDTEFEVQKILSLGEKLGLKLNPDSAGSAPRMPASATKSR